MAWTTNVLVGQSGGPTAVINSSLAGVYESAKSLGAPHVYGMQYGIEGLLQGHFVDLDQYFSDKMQIELLKRTPSSFLGSCRFKLPEASVDDRPYRKLFELFEQHAIGAVFYIGGNDSMDTIAKLSGQVRRHPPQGSHLRRQRLQHPQRHRGRDHGPPHRLAGRRGLPGQGYRLRRPRHHSAARAPL